MFVYKDRYVRYGILSSRDLQKLSHRTQSLGHVCVQQELYLQQRAVLEKISLTENEKFIIKSKEIECLPNNNEIRKKKNITKQQFSTI